MNKLNDWPAGGKTKGHRASVATSFLRGLCCFTGAWNIRSFVKHNEAGKYCWRAKDRATSNQMSAMQVTPGWSQDSAEWHSERHTRLGSGAQYRWHLTFARDVLCLIILHCVRKKEPPKNFATRTALSRAHTSAAKDADRTKLLLLSGRREKDTHCRGSADLWSGLPIQQRIEFKVAVLAFDCVRGTCPSNFCGICTPLTEVGGRVRLGSAHRGDLCAPSTRTEFGKRSFRVAAPRTWNFLPLHLRSPTICRQQFQSGLKTHLFKRAYIWLSPPRTIEEWTYSFTYLLTYQNLCTTPCWHAFDMSNKYYLLTYFSQPNPNPNVTWSGLPPKSNRFFRGPCAATFPLNLVKIGQVVFA